MQECNIQNNACAVIHMENMGWQKILIAPTHVLETPLKCVGDSGETLYMQVRGKSTSWYTLECCISYTCQKLKQHPYINGNK